MLVLVRRLFQLTVAWVQVRISAPAQADGGVDDEERRLSKGEAGGEVA